jgi:transcriptional regulator with XRE-family HTH domain
MTLANPALFGRLLRAHRERRGLTRRQLSQAVACAEVTLRKIETGERRPSLQMAQLLADALQLAPAEQAIFLAEASAIAGNPTAGVTHSSADHLLALAEDATHRYTDEVQRQVLDELEARLEEIRAQLKRLLRDDAQGAQHFAGALREFWLKRSHMAEGLRWLNQALLLDVSPTEHRARALLAAGMIAAFQNDYPRAHRHLDECLILCGRLDLVDVYARVLGTKGWLALWGDGPQSESLALYTQCIAAHDQLGDHRRSAHGRCDLAMAFLYQATPDIPRAEQLAREGLMSFRECACAHGEAFAMHVLTQVKTATGELAEAEAYEAGALAIFRQIGGKRDVAWALAHLGDIELMRGHLEQARLYREESLVAFQEIEERNAVCVTLHALAQIAREAGDLPLAQQRLIAGLHLAHEWQRPYVLVHGLYELAGVRWALGCTAHAALLLGAADALAAQHALAYPPHETARFGAWREAVRMAMGDANFSTAVQSGASMSLEQVIACVAGTSGHEPQSG